MSGDQILDVSGSVVVLRGVNRVGFEQWPHGVWPDYASTQPYDSIDIAKIRSLNANVVRVPLGSQFWLPNWAPCVFEHVDTYLSDIDSMVNWITSNHMVALLDLHTEVPPGSACPGQGQYQAAPAPDVNAPTFWRDVASRYKGNSLVAFDLWNEPHGISNSVWLNGGLVTSAVPPYQAVGMQQLYDTIRSVGATNLVFIDGNGYAGDPSPILNDPVRGTDIVYAEHDYTCSSSLPPPQGMCLTPDPYDPSPGLNAWTPVRLTHPVVITEFGWPDGTNGTFDQNLITDVESTLVPPAPPAPYAPYSGWLTFAWDGPRGSPPGGANPLPIPGDLLGMTDGDPWGLFSDWRYAGCPNACQTNYTWPANGRAAAVFSGWAKNS